jgi:hypothetical protein
MGDWKLHGYDAFSGEEYPLLADDFTTPLELDTEAEARAEASRQLARLEREQPSVTSGGQAPGGIQDRVYIVGPGGTRYRWGGQP